MNTQDRLRQAARFTRLDADRELLTEAADALDRRDAVIKLLEGEVADQQPATQPADVTDEQIDAIADRISYPMLDRPTIRQFARAILALRPVQVPMTDEQIAKAEAQVWVATWLDDTERQSNREFARLIEALHGITPKEQA